MRINKKGFTLIELLGVLVILALIATLTYPAVTKIVKDSSKQVTETNIDTVFDAAYNWLLENPKSTPKVNNASITIRVEDLKKGGYLDINVKEADNLENIPNDSTITITKNGTFSSSTDCKSTTSSSCQYYKYYGDYLFAFKKGTAGISYNPKSPTIILNGDPTVYLDLGDSYDELGATAKSYTNSDLTDDIETTIFDGANTSTSTIVAKINSNTLKSYSVQYSVSDTQNNESSAYRTVIIRDTEAPEITLPNIEDNEVTLPIDLNNSKYNATCKDNSGVCSITKTLIGNNTLKPGNKIIIVYTATDSSNNKSEQRLVLTIK